MYGRFGRGGTGRGRGIERGRGLNNNNRIDDQFNNRKDRNENEVNPIDNNNDDNNNNVASAAVRSGQQNIASVNTKNTNNINNTNNTNNNIVNCQNGQVLANDKRVCYEFAVSRGPSHYHAILPPMEWSTEDGETRRIRRGGRG